MSVVRTATVALQGGRRDRIMPWVLAGATGMTAVLVYGVPQLRWVVWIVAAVAFGVVLAQVRDLHRFLLASLILSLQVEARLKFFYQEASSWVGQSSPTAIELPFCVLIALALLVFQVRGGAVAVGRLGVPSAVRAPILLLAMSAMLSIPGSPERFIGLCWLVRLANLSLLLGVTAVAVRSREDVRLVADMLAISLVVQSVIYVIEAVLGVTFSAEGAVFAARDGLPRHGGTVGAHANTFASFIIPLVLVTLARVMLGVGRRSRLPLTTIALVGLCTVVITFTRAAWVGCALGVFVVMAGGIVLGRIKPKAVLVLVLFGVVVLPLLGPAILERLAADNAADYEERAALMQMAWLVFRAYPWLGCGAGAYTYVFRRFLTADLAGRWLYVVHNRYLLVAAEMGIFGAVAFIAFFMRIITLGWRLAYVKDPELSAFALGSTAAFVALAWNSYWDVLGVLPVDGLTWVLAGTLCAMQGLAPGQVREGARA